MTKKYPGSTVRSVVFFVSSLFFMLSLLFSEQALSADNEEYTDTTAPDVIPFLPAGIESDVLGVATGSFLSIPSNGREPLGQIGAYIPGIEPSPPRRLPGSWDATLPEIPANNRNVTGIVNNEFVRPHIPPHRFSADARLGINSQGGSFLQLYLYSPEKIQQTFVESPSGPQILAESQGDNLRVELDVSTLTGGAYNSVAHTNICEPYTDKDQKKRNPYTCGVDGKDDCYDITIISSANPTNDLVGQYLLAKLVSSPITVRVEKPKTTQAKIAEVTYGESKIGNKQHGIIFETITPADGRLLFGRRSGENRPLTYTNHNTGLTQAGLYDVIYAVAPEDAEPCDVTYWDDLYPLSHAPHDPRLKDRYDFAKYPFRDPVGQVIADGVDIKGSYPWMDKEAKNLSMTVSTARLFPEYFHTGSEQTRYPTRSAVSGGSTGDRADFQPLARDIGYVIMGAWTHGKMIHMDGLLNDTDFMLGINDKHHSIAKLYQADGADAGEVRVGATRGTDYTKLTRPNGDQANFLANNISMFDSVENRFNFWEHLKPATAKDVVWTIGSGHSTDEFAFDDYLNPNGFIVSDMVAALNSYNYHPFQMTLYNGWNHEDLGFTSQVRVQNGATATKDNWNIPAHGQVVNGRMEPVANGGVRGKGMWLNGNHAFVSYGIGLQPQNVNNSDWYSSIFVDPRFEDDNIERAIINFPDHTVITMLGKRAIRYRHPSYGVVNEITLPKPIADKEWVHLGFQLSNQGKHVRFLLNGFPYQEWTSPNIPIMKSVAVTAMVPIKEMVAVMETVAVTESVAVTEKVAITETVPVYQQFFSLFSSWLGITGYVEKVVGYFDKVVGYVEEIVGYVEKVVGYNEEVVGYAEDVVGYAEEITGYTQPTMFQMNPGQLLVGDTLKNAVTHGLTGTFANLLNVNDPMPEWGVQSFRGWIDEFKVLAHSPDIESSCNHAQGTLVGLPSDSELDLMNVANQYSDKMHDVVAEQLRMRGEPTYDSYACFHDYLSDFVAHKKSIPEGAASLRDSIQFPEGPIYHDAPRPESVYNEFCLSCHHDKGELGLNTVALLRDKQTLAKNDPRRQPSQPPRYVSGNLPANWLPTSPNYDDSTGDYGMLFDELNLPSSMDAFSEIKGFTLVHADTGQNIRALSNGSVLSSSEMQSNNWVIRANTNGLTTEVTFTLNGSVSSSNGAQFTRSVSHLANGCHTLSAQGTVNGGRASNVVSLSFLMSDASAENSTECATIFNEPT